MASEHGPWIWMCRDTGARNETQGRDRTRVPSWLGQQLIQSTQAHQAYDTLGQRDRLGTDIHTEDSDEKHGSHGQRALLLLTCRSCQKPGGTH